MHRFQNIVFTCTEIEKNSTALLQALRIASANKAELTIAIWQPAPPSSMKDYKAAMHDSLNKAMHEQIEHICSQNESIDKTTVMSNLTIEIFHEAPYAVEMIRRVIQKKYDLLVKDVAAPEDKNLHSVDMTFLRKCPAPVLLCRKEQKDKLSAEVVAVAIDPLSEEAAARDLSIDLLKLGHTRAERSGGKLVILSCWDCKWERSARQNSFISIPEDQINAQVEQTRANHESALKEIISQAGLAEDSYSLNIQKGQAEQLIPDTVRELDAAVLIMGTVARTGIPGFLIGNTAENIIQRVNCSLLAVKPGGFVSPIKAY